MPTLSALGTAASSSFQTCHDTPLVKLEYGPDMWVVLRKGVPMCDIELVALDLHVLVANRLVQCATYTVIITV